MHPPLRLSLGAREPHENICWFSTPIAGILPRGTKRPAAGAPTPSGPPGPAGPAITTASSSPAQPNDPATPNVVVFVSAAFLVDPAGCSFAAGSNSVSFSWTVLKASSPKVWTTAPRASAAFSRTDQMLSHTWRKKSSYSSDRRLRASSGKLCTMRPSAMHAASRTGQLSSRKQSIRIVSISGTNGATASVLTFSPSSARHAHAASRTAWFGASACVM
mmetsp:Transcript_2314/g.5653  ORF Transcript_2314/g.5653 Transcript_2314/m.5653 type:complete len:218 (+) Transcript_2314:2204-2857(+)